MPPRVRTTVQRHFCKGVSINTSIARRDFKYNGSFKADCWLLYALAPFLPGEKEAGNAEKSEARESRC